MNFKKTLAIGFLVGGLSMTSAAFAAGKNAATPTTKDIVGPVVDINSNARYVTVKDSYSGKMYTFYVAKGSKVSSLSTLQHYLDFERLQKGVVLSVRVQESNSDTIQAKSR